MRSLAATGWLNFRMRAMVASVAAYHLWLDWRDYGPPLARLFTDYEPGIHWPPGADAVRGHRDQHDPGLQPRQAVARPGPDRASSCGAGCPSSPGVPAALLHEPWRMDAAMAREAGCRIGVDYPAPHPRPCRGRARRARPALRGAPGRSGLRGRERADRPQARLAPPAERPRARARPAATPPSSRSTSEVRHAPDAPQGRPARKDLRRLRPSLRLARMGARLESVRWCSDRCRAEVAAAPKERLIGSGPRLDIP